jgi:hypothetical protein
MLYNGDALNASRAHRSLEKEKMHTPALGWLGVRIIDIQ